MKILVVGAKYFSPLHDFPFVIFVSFVVKYFFHFVPLRLCARLSDLLLHNFQNLIGPDRQILDS
jgi:hypothetical protein